MRTNTDTRKNVRYSGVPPLLCGYRLSILCALALAEGIGAPRFLHFRYRIGFSPSTTWCLKRKRKCMQEIETVLKGSKKVRVKLGEIKDCPREYTDARQG